ncbi:MAG: M48 family peptidase, partial [Planctomycetota bacterium]
MTAAFLVVLCIGTAIRLYLAVRQIGCVRSHREVVPDAFAQRIGLEAHRKAADYTVDRTRVGIFSRVFGVCILLIWTLGGGIDLVSGLIEDGSIA